MKMQTSNNEIRFHCIRKTSFEQKIRGGVFVQLGGKRWLQRSLTSLIAMGYVWAGVIWVGNPSASIESHAQTEVLKMGVTGKQVEQLQALLKELGYFSVHTTEYFGLITQKAVKDFQDDEGILVDGVVGNETKRALEMRQESVELPIKKGMEGEPVQSLQKKLKAIGYFQYDETGYFGEITQKAVKDFQKNAGLSVDGVVGKETMNALKKARDNYSNPASNITSNTSQTKSIGELIAWFKGGSDIFGLDNIAIVTDLKTQKQFKVKRTGGYNHADVETLTKEDTKILKSVYGGNFSWDRRAVIIEVGGRRIAASMTGMPHAGKDDEPARTLVENRSGGYGTGVNYDSIKQNDMEGHIDIHLKDSRTHGTNRVDERHQSMIFKAAGK